MGPELLGVGISGSRGVPGAGRRPPFLSVGLGCLVSCPAATTSSRVDRCRPREGSRVVPGPEQTRKSLISLGLWRNARDPGALGLSSDRAGPPGVSEGGRARARTGQAAERPASCRGKQPGGRGAEERKRDGARGLDSRKTAGHAPSSPRVAGARSRVSPPRTIFAVD